MATGRAQETVLHKTIILGSQQVRYSEAGRDGAEPIVFIHGGASTRRDWLETLAALSQTYKVYAPDLIGYGESDRSLPRYSLSHFTTVIRDFTQALGIERAHFVGHSLGGRICLETAGLYPNAVKSMTVIAPMGLGRLTVLGQALVGAVWIKLHILRSPLPYPKLDIRLSDPNMDSYNGIVVPSLVVWGKKDMYFPHRYGVKMASMLPNSSFELFEDCGHAPHRESPEKFQSMLTRFLASSA